MIAVVKSTEIRKNRDGDHDVLMITAEIGDTDDVQSIELACAMGEDFNPPAGTRLILQETGSAYKVAVAGDDGIAPTTNVGERKIYSISGGAVSAVAYFKADGTLQLNNGSGTAVEFARLKKAFNQLKSDFDMHTHSYGPLMDSLGVGVKALSPVPIPLPPEFALTTATTTASSADIDPAESKTVKLP